MNHHHRLNDKCVTKRKRFYMTLRQKILKFFYPLIRKVSGELSVKQLILNNKTSATPPTSFYNLSAMANNGNILHFEQLRGKKVLLVNTASDCGYTGQYEELEK